MWKTFTEWIVISYLGNVFGLKKFKISSFRSPKYISMQYRYNIISNQESLETHKSQTRPKSLKVKIHLYQKKPKFEGFVLIFVLRFAP